MFFFQLGRLWRVVEVDGVERIDILSNKQLHVSACRPTTSNALRATRLDHGGSFRTMGDTPSNREIIVLFEIVLFVTFTVIFYFDGSKFQIETFQVRRIYIIHVMHA